MVTAVSSLAFTMQMQVRREPPSHHLTPEPPPDTRLHSSLFHWHGNLFHHKQLENEPLDSDMEGLFPGLLSVNQDDILCRDQKLFFMFQTDHLFQGHKRVINLQTHY